MFKIQITCIGRENLRSDTNYIFDTITEEVETLEEIKTYLINRYNKIPNEYLYVDTDKGLKKVGFTYSYWNKDISHNSKSWFQTDWIEIFEYNETTIEEDKLLYLKK
jgi:hypothetical protein